MHTEVDWGVVLGRFLSRRDLLNFVGPSRSISVIERFQLTSRGHVVVLNNLLECFETGCHILDRIRNMTGESPFVGNTLKTYPFPPK